MFNYSMLYLALIVGIVREFFETDLPDPPSFFRTFSLDLKELIYKKGRASVHNMHFLFYCTSTRSCRLTPSAASVLCALTEISAFPIVTGRIGMKSVSVESADTLNRKSETSVDDYPDVQNLKFSI